MGEPITLVILLGIAGFLLTLIGTVAKASGNLTTRIATLTEQMAHLSSVVEKQTVVFEGLTARVTALELQVAIIKTLQEKNNARQAP